MPLWSTTSNKVLRLEVADVRDDFKPFSFPHESFPVTRQANPHADCFPTPTEAVLFPITQAKNSKPTDGHFTPPSKSSGSAPVCRFISTPSRLSSLEPIY